MKARHRHTAKQRNKKQNRQLLFQEFQELQSQQLLELKESLMNEIELFIETCYIGPVKKLVHNWKREGF